MAVERPVLLRFMLLYGALFSAFGCASPFLPAFLAGRGLGPEELGLVLGGATAIRLVCGPIAGRIADRLHRSGQDRNFLQLTVSEERQRAAVGRPERLECTFGPGDEARASLGQRSQPEAIDPFRIGRHESNVPSVG